MKKLKTLATVALLFPITTYALAGRKIERLLGYARASADLAVEEFENEVPRDVHDRKTQQELADLRQDLVDRQVRLHQSKSQIKQLQTDVTLLTESLDRRQRLLSEAYSLLASATTEHSATVQFANQQFAIAEFQAELDSLLALQEREEKEREIKNQGLSRLRQSEQQAEQALASMQTVLEQAEQEVDVLVARRAQAELEGQTLDMAAAVAGNSLLSDDAIAGSLARLRNEVSSLETRNEARRALAPAGTVSGSNRLARQWNRLEALKAFTERPPQESTTLVNPLSVASANSQATGNSVLPAADSSQTTLVDAEPVK
ncbi:MAG: hypothetical protein ACK5EA_06860 [Planctomycetaceae bacterium]|jgi:chromosome segregation ATPase